MKNSNLINKESKENELILLPNSALKALKLWEEHFF